MGYKNATSQEKLQCTLFVSVLFLIISNPMTYKITHKLFGKMLGSIANPSNGCPTNTGLLLHTLVFGVLLRGMMELK
tara:strand:+ start:746 stop:976 length:231 start_codon:yes stop_codon:yes gene_type:complete